MLQIQQFLRNSGTPESLRETYAIKSNRHKRYPNLVLFKYDQIDSPMGERIVQEARGIILDEADNWRVVGRGFDKFFNYGEGLAAQIDWTTARVQEKVDGSLIMLYEYNGEWQVATSGSPDASGVVGDEGFTFRELFLRVWGERPLPSLHMCLDYCFLFELCTEYNRIIVPHQESKIVYLATRDRVMGSYVLFSKFIFAVIPSVREFPLTSMDAIVKSFEHINGFDQEGYVVVDGQGNRIKVKHPQYVALHHVRDQLGPKWLVKVIVSGEVPEVLSVFPKYQEEFATMTARYEALVAEIESAFIETKHIENQKEFALAVKDKGYAAVLFALRSNKVSSVKQWLAQELHFPKVLRLLDVRVDKELPKLC